VDNILTSGYLAFPFAPLPVAWKVPFIYDLAFQHKVEWAAIACNGQAEGCKEAGFGEWAKFFFMKHKPQIVLPTLFFLCGALAGRRVWTARTMTVILPAAAAFVSAYLLIPGCRYLAGSLWIPGMVLSAAALESQAGILRQFKLHWIVLGAVIVFLGYAAHTI